MILFRLYSVHHQKRGSHKVIPIISQVSKINENLTFRLLVAEKENPKSQTMRGGLALSQLYCVHETDLETQSNRNQKDLDCGWIEGEMGCEQKKKLCDIYKDLRFWGSNFGACSHLISEFLIFNRQFGVFCPPSMKKKRPWWPGDEDISCLVVCCGGGG